MSGYQSITMAATGVLLLCLTVSPNAFALPKGSIQNCTTKDLNTNFGASCNDQMQQDLLNNKPYTHVLFCGGDTMLCCTVDNATNQVINCRKPAGTRLAPQTQVLPQAGSVLRRGVEGEEEIGESAPVPSWVTESAMKEQAGEKKP
jgi:hypothetical protein